MKNHEVAEISCKKNIEQGFCFKMGIILKMEQCIHVFICAKKGLQVCLICFTSLVYLIMQEKEPFKPIHLHLKQRQPKEPKQQIVFKAQVPCSELVKFVLEKNFGRGKDRLIYLDNTSTHGKFFYKCIENPCNKHDKDYKGYPSSVTVVLSENVFIKKGILLTPTDIVSFNTFVTKLLYQAVWLYIEAREDASVNHVTAKRLMDEFCIKYGYSEDLLSYERLKKAKQFRNNSDKGLNIC